MLNMRRNVVASLFAFAVLVSSSSAFAGTAYSQRIAQIGVYGSSTTPYVIFYLENGVSNSPSCVGWGGSMVLDISTARGKALQQMLTSAYLSGRNVYIQGSGSCVTPSGSGGLAMETITYAMMQQ